ncbi:hypothetical protein SAMN05216596_101881 [Pseudomonas congelans]|uniref:Uncharacterized protein n=1 Tax=Pseudomonas congelans TaxID=200452 RepID=A0A1H0KV16_9PSED|nr:hypothetical protein [Pseudomonas congelans]MBP1143130.1 hypothetical protein [Pseudomonas sp. PvP027]SDO59642.1 hypothetical protein SAMN05216596_101881 [Pseudomonas congelans]
MRHRYQVGAWLSLFAMLMIFAGSLISHGISQGINLVHGKASRCKWLAWTTGS